MPKWRNKSGIDCHFWHICWTPVSAVVIYWLISPSPCPNFVVLLQLHTRHNSWQKVKQFVSHLYLCPFPCALLCRKHSWRSNQEMLTPSWHLVSPLVAGVHECTPRWFIVCVTVAMLRYFIILHSGVVTLQFVIITQFVINYKLRWIATQFVIHYKLRSEF